MTYVMFAYITRTIRFTNTHWFDMMTNTINDLNISITYITKSHRFIGI